MTRLILNQIMIVDEIRCSYCDNVSRTYMCGEIKLSLTKSELHVRGLSYLGIFLKINLFHAAVLSLYSLEISENHRIFDVFRGLRKRSVI